MKREACPRCGSVRFVKSGFLNAKQRFKCKDCNRLFLETDEQSYPPKIKQKALQLYVEGLGFRSIERILGISNVTVMNWVKQVGLQALAELKNAPAQAEVIELDELCTYIQKKSKSAGCGLLLTVSPLESLVCNSVVVVSQQH